MVMMFVQCGLLALPNSRPAHGTGRLSLYNIHTFLLHINLYYIDNWHRQSQVRLLGTPSAALCAVMRASFRIAIDPSAVLAAIIPASFCIASFCIDLIATLYLRLHYDLNLWLWKELTCLCWGLSQTSSNLCSVYTRC